MEVSQTTDNIKGKDISIKLNGLTICYDDLGKGEIPIIFIHGFPFNKSMWQTQIEFFKKTNRVIAYDIRGFGKSGSGNMKESITSFADDLIKFMDGLEIKKAIVCGFSMGGYILLNAVSNHPKRFEALILSDTQCISDSPEVKEKRAQTIAQITFGKLKEFAEGFTKAVFCKESLETKQELVEKTKEMILSTSPLTITGTLNALAERHQMCSALDEITVPVLVICGKEDVVTPPFQAAYLHTNIANSKLRMIDEAGHMSNLEQPNVFNQHIADFVSGLTK